MKLTTCLLALVSLCVVARAADRPNIVFILTDDQRWDCLSIAGHPFLKTPNIDRIGNEGEHFKNAFVTLPLGFAAGANFFTGTYAHHHGIVGNALKYGEMSHKLDTYH